ncbi:MAG: DsbA family oxidoreductase [Nitrososphaerales archaeon]|jgi:predicted DsbA family dithiol-disulfide isomerase
MLVEIWEDVVCPWCYIGERRFQSALEGFPHRDDVQIVRRSFELDPAAPGKSGQTVTELLSGKYGLSLEEASRREGEMIRLAAVEGLTIRPERFVANTRDAHRILHLASERGLQAPMAERLFSAYFSEGRDIGDPDALVKIAGEAGIEEDEARAVLAGDAYGAQVDADELQARELGANGVPFFVIDRRYGVSGAQKAETFLRVLETAWKERSRTPASKTPDGARA